MALDMSTLFNVEPVAANAYTGANDLFGGGGLFDEPKKPAKTEAAPEPVEVPVPEPAKVSEPEPDKAAVTEPVAETKTEETVPVVTAKSKKAKKAVESADDDAVEFTDAKHKPQKISVTALKKVFLSSFEDPQWEAIKQDLQERTKNVKIEPELTYGACRVLLAQTTNLLSDLLAVQSENKKFYDRLCDKAIGLIPRQEGINAQGKNEADRKRNSYLSCEEYMGSYNLFDIAGVLFDRIAVIDSLVADVKQKKETLVSFLAIFKLEAASK